jgi:hypothetical protein
MSKTGDDFIELDVQAALPVESDMALSNFVEINPNYRGAEWADVLDILGDADANLEVTEPIWEALEAVSNHGMPVVRGQAVPTHLITYVTLTLLYAHKTPPSAFDVEGKCEAVMGWIEANPMQRHFRGAPTPPTPPTTATPGKVQVRGYYRLVKGQPVWVRGYER